MGLIKQLVPWTMQPPGTKTIDWVNPITKSLVCAYVPDTVMNRVTSRDASIYYNGIDRGSQGLVAVGNDSYIAMYLGNPGMSVAAGQNFTLVFATPRASMAGSNPGLFRYGSGSLTANAAGTGTTFCIFQGSGSNRPWIRLQGIDILKPSSGQQLITGAPAVIAYSIRSGSYASVAWNGAVRYAVSHVTNTAAGTFSYVGAQNTPSDRVGNLSAFFYFAREMSEAELVSITKNPWQIFAP